MNSVSNEELKEEFLNNWSMSVKIAKSLKEEKEQLLVTFSDDVNEEIPYEFIKSILEKNYGIRDVEQDLGGYVVIAENIVDIEIMKQDKLQV